MFLSLLGIAELLLTLWVSKEKDKYNSELKRLREQYEIEINKPDELFNDAAVDYLERQLCIVADALTAQIRIQNA